MRIFYRTKTNEIACIDTIETPVFLSCLKKEVEFLSQTDKDTDSFFIPQDTGMEESAVEDFVKQVFLKNEEMDFDLTMETKE